MLKQLSSIIVVNTGDSHLIVSIKISHNNNPTAKWKHGIYISSYKWEIWGLIWRNNYEFSAGYWQLDSDTLKMLSSR